MNSILKKSLSAIMFFCLMFLCLGLSVRVNAVSVKYSYTFTATQFTENGSKELNNVNWTISGDGEYWGYNGTKGQQFGSGTKPYKTLTITTSDIPGVISKVTLNTSGASSINAKLDVTVGDVKYGNTESLTATATDYIFEGTGSGEIKFTYTQTSSKAIYIKTIIIEYDDPNGKSSIVLSNEKSQCKLGETIQLTKEVTGIEEPYELDWVVESSNGGVATVDENGIFNATAFGTFNVSAKIGDVASTPVTLKVYPDNANPISVSDALKVCEITGASNSPYEYTLIGEVTGNNDVIYLTDATGSIYTYGSELSVGEKVQLIGILKTYNETKEIANYTVKRFFNVTFNSDGGSEVENLTDVLEGSKIDAPAVPTKENYSLAGWYNGNEQWDFDTDIVTSDVTLTAKWVLSSLDTVFAQVNDYNSYMCVAYKYSSEDGVISDELTLASTGVSGASYTDWSGKSILSSAVYAGQSAGGKDSIQLRSNNSNSGIVTTVSGGKITKITVEWQGETDEGRTLDIYGSNNPYTSPTELYSSGTRGTKLGSIVCGTSTELDISGDYKYIGLRSNSGAMYLSSISIDWETTVYSNDEFRIKMGIDKGLSAVAEQVDGAKYGIEVSTDSKTQKYYSTDELYKVEEGAEGKEYVIINLGAFLQNHSRISEEFTVKAFIEYDGVTYYSEQSKTYSIKTLVEKYLELGYSEVETLKTTLENLGYTFE